jgi:tetratricopeptide (TPR) repeat protein
MKIKTIFLLAILSFSAAAGAQEFPNEPYEFILAKLASDEGRVDEALSRIDRIIEKNPNDPVLMFERAMMLIDAGRTERAEQELRHVVALAPTLYDAQKMLGRLLLDGSGGDRAKVEDALTHLQAAFKLDANDLQTGVTISQIMLSMGKINEAERVLATLVERAPDQRGINYNYAQVLTRLGRTGDAKTYLERAVALDSTFGPAILQLIDIYQKDAAWQRAAEVLQPLVDEDPQNLELQRQQAYFYLRAGSASQARDRFRELVAADPKDERSLFYLAESLNDLEQYAEAGKYFRQLLANSPKDPDYLSSYGLALVGQRQWEEARGTFSAILQLSDVPENLQALARTQLANIELQQGNYDRAITTAQSVFLFREKPNAQAINIALEALKKQNKTNEAIALLQPLAEKYGDDPFVNARYIEMLVRAGDKTRAQQYAAAQTKLSPRHMIAAAEAYMQAGEPGSAIALFKQAADAKPDDLDLQFQLASMHERAGDKKAAEKAFLAILEKKPEHAPTLNYLGYMWAEEGKNLTRAHEMLTRAVSQDPENGAYIDSLGWVYYQLGNYEEAEKYLTDATRLMPRDATVHEHLADALAKRGETERALQVYRQALTLDPDSKDGAKIRAKIAEIERRSQTSQR